MTEFKGLASFLLLDAHVRHIICFQIWKELRHVPANSAVLEGKAIQPHRVLIADDEFLIRWSLGQALAKEGYEVTSVEDGRKAIEALESQSFDFVITDLVMPELSGWEVLEVIRNTYPSARVILITAHGREDTQRIAKEKGVWAYVEKPYIIEKIKDILNHACEPNPARDTN